MIGRVIRSNPCCSRVEVSVSVGIRVKLLTLQPAAESQFCGSLVQEQDADAS
jgi:hypothetical protein